MRTVDKQQDSVREMREYAFWAGRRDELIKEALALDISLNRISETMNISKTTIRVVMDREGIPRRTNGHVGKHKNHTVHSRT